MQHTCKPDRIDDAVREVLDRLGTTGPHYAALAPYDRLVVASAAAVALSVNIEGNASVPDAADALLCEAREIVCTDLPTEAVSMNVLLAGVAHILDDHEGVGHRNVTRKIRQ